MLTVDDQGRFTSVVPDFEGQHVFDANDGIAAKLRAQGSLVRQETLHALLPALLALPQPADLQGGVELVRRGDHGSRTGWSS